jgi:hypothetical protein
MLEAAHAAAAAMAGATVCMHQAFIMLFKCFTFNDRQHNPLAQIGFVGKAVCCMQQCNCEAQACFHATSLIQFYCVLWFDCYYRTCGAARP